MRNKQEIIDMSNFEFRVWDIERKKYFDAGKWALEDLFEDGYYIPEQFTGLTDKNEQWLYANDLFRHDAYPDMIFRVWATIGGFCINAPVKQWQSDIALDEPFLNHEALADLQTLGWMKDRFEIIGNIHQNPELLL